MRIFVNFHDLVGVTVETESEAAGEFFAAEYGHHLADALPEGVPQIKLHFRQSAGFSAPRGYTLHTHKALARWAYRLRFDARRIEIEAIGNHMAVPMVHHMMVHPSLRYLSAMQGVLMLHAGAVTSGGRSLILTGHGGAGKTTTTSILLDAGGEAWGLHADDYVFLEDGPQSLAYLTRAHLYLPLLQWVPDLPARLTAGERVRLEVFGRVRAWSQERIKWPLRLDLQRLWPGRNLVMRAAPAALVILERADVSTPEAIRLKDADFPLDALMAMNFNEARHFIHLVRKSAAVPDIDSWLDDWRAKERNLLDARRREIPAFVLRLPKHADDLETARHQVVDGITAILNAPEN